MTHSEQTVLLTDFKTYNTSNWKATLFDFIYKVDPQATVHQKIKVAPLQDLSNKYLTILSKLSFSCYCSPCVVSTSLRPRCLLSRKVSNTTYIL